MLRFDSRDHFSGENYLRHLGFTEEHIERLRQIKRLYEAGAFRKKGDSGETVY